jgi:L-serine dehydratase
MVGPSSSHTAGAVKLGIAARKLCQANIRRVDFYLHGSFAETYKALLGGILGMGTDDERIRNSFHYARERGLEFFFHTVNLGNVHPNTVKIVLQDEENNTEELIGFSVGGGQIRITSINNVPVEFTGQYPTIVTQQEDKPGVIARVTGLIGNHDINIAFLRVFRQARGSLASMVIETDQHISRSLVQAIENIPEIKKCIFISFD